MEFVEAPEETSPLAVLDARVRLPYDFAYRSLSIGAAFTIVEGARIVGHGRVVVAQVPAAADAGVFYVLAGNDGPPCRSWRWTTGEFMSQAASQAAAFYRDVAKNRMVWTIEDAGGVPAPMTTDGRRSMPFWSSLSRAQQIVETVAAYSGFRPRAISWQEFECKWLQGLKNDGYLVGINWSGAGATGYDCEPDDVARNIGHYLDHGSADAPGA